MPVRAELLAVLACPSADHAPLRLEVTESTEELVCTVCLSRFPVIDGLPVLIADDATPGPNGLGVAADAVESDATTAAPVAGGDN